MTQDRDLNKVVVLLQEDQSGRHSRQVELCKHGSVWPECHKKGGRLRT